MINHKSNSILIIDFGSQYTQLIARRVRDSGVYSIVEPNNIYSLNQALEKLIINKNLRIKMGKESRIFALNKFVNFKLLICWVPCQSMSNSTSFP